MQEYVNITLDGAKVRAIKGSTVFDTASAYGVCIPHLCHLRNASGLGACRLCVVEVVKNGRGKVTTSCTLEAKEGMVVQANSDKIRRIRKNIAESLKTIYETAEDTVELAVAETGEDYDLNEMIRQLEKEMMEAAEALEFERAAVLRDQIKKLEKSV